MRRLRLILFHLGQHIPHNPLPMVLRHIQQLRPRQNMVKIVLHLVVLREAPEVGGLHLEEVVHGGLADADHGVERGGGGRGTEEGVAV